MTTLAFVCVGNAGRSQLAAGLAEKEADRRTLDVDIVTGGTDPKNHVYDEVRTVLQEVGVDIGDRAPRQITRDDLAAAEYVITLGCDIEAFLPSEWAGEHRSWTIETAGGDLPAVRAQRNEIDELVVDLFDELEEVGAG